MEYQSLRNEYCGMPISDVHTVDTDMVSHVIADLKRGKAAGIDGLSAEHLLFCHPSVCGTGQIVSAHDVMWLYPGWFPI